MMRSLFQKNKGEELYSVQALLNRLMMACIISKWYIQSDLPLFT